MTRDALRAQIVAALGGYVREPNMYMTTRAEAAADALLDGPLAPLLGVTGGGE